MPIGPVGESVELHQTTSISIFKHTKYPEAALAYLQFMYDADRMNAWITGASAYCCGALKDFANNPVWTSNPIHAPYAKASATLRPNGYAGPLGYASAGVMADYVLVDMFAQAVTGQASTDDAVATALKRANRYYV
jgi:multiple sugar transport system substrate-binding protein